MGFALRTAGSKLLARVLVGLDKLSCFCFGHLDEVTETQQHSLLCTCFDGGTHGVIKYCCARCERKRSRLELIC